MTLVALLLALLPGQVLSQDRMRTGMVEAGARAWAVDREAGQVGLVGISASRLITDNVSLGLLAAIPHGVGQSDALLVDAQARLYFLAETPVTPWLEGRTGGLIQTQGGNRATHLGAGFGLRWRPVGFLALDLQLVGFERWGYDDPTEGTNGNADWTLQKSPILLSLSGGDGWRILPVPSIQFLF